MIRLHQYIIFHFLLLGSMLAAKGQQPARRYINPMAHTSSLSGNFGELRPNHFHAGVDFRTEGATGKPVVSIADGYVSRISIDAGGYGKKLYIAHPATGETSVYAHLDHFAPPVDEAVRAYQYAHQTFCMDITFCPDELPVKQGEVAAYSGNTGSSIAPHLHFELHDTETDDLIDPLLYDFGLEDDIKPRFFSLKVYPQKGEGSLNNSSNNKVYALITNDKGVARFAKPAVIRAWGKVGTGIRALDYMNNTANVFGIRSIRLEVDGKVVSHYRNAGFRRDDLRSINSVIDYEAFCQSGVYYLKSFVDEGNLSDLYETAVNRGFIIIHEERNYRIKYTLADAFGNESVLSFTIKGEKPKVPPPAKTSACLCRMPFDVDNRFETEEVSLFVPKHALYTDICFRYAKEDKPDSYSAYHRLHTECTPLHSDCEVAIRITKGEVRDSAKLYVESLNYSGRRRACMGRFAHGIYSFRTRELGSFVVKADSIAPTVSPVNISATRRGGLITSRITDVQTGIGSYNGYIDNRWVLFEYDVKSAQIRCHFTEREITPNKRHQLKLIVSDKVGNERVVEKNFYW